VLNPDNEGKGGTKKVLKVVDKKEGGKGRKESRKKDYEGKW